ncbi:superfamily I DNA/RNA helicase [Desulfitobacterium sp. LBE]|uniref:UvrD-helicase domain-containing protein n=1 Tax=Desulfitobacterium sp. LBE TaxID=884086 RepID=UPI00119C7627|nr:ATP-dependent helicase [Desulfitobacterium sp. LBE]TWH59616.1 superfamily I DNA/RNA helicase [Desulfitobacterium sp. LBE]
MTNKIVRDTEWKPIDGMKLEESALSAVRENNNVLVTAGPGAGKTELLAQKACYLLQTDKCINPRKILAISLKTDAADNLKKRVEKRAKETSERFISMTYDAFAKGLLDRFRKGLPEKYRPKPNYLIGEDADIHIQLAFEKAGFVNRKRLSPSKLKSYFHNQLAAVTLPITSNTMREKVWLLLIKGDADIRPCLTFQMVSRLTEYIIKTNPTLKYSILLTYSHVFLDEFQDTTEIQYELVKTCFMNTNTNITAVGDNKQRIMVWAGALETAFNDYRSDFSSIDKTLLMNHRSAPKLVELQRMMYASLQDDPKEIYCSDKWKQDEGEVRLFKFDNTVTEAKNIAADIINLYTQGVELKDICILTKQQPEKYTVDLIKTLAENGIRARVETEYQDLLKEPISLLIINSLYLIVKKKNPDSWEVITNYLNKAYSGQISCNFDYLIDKQTELTAILKGHKKDLLQCEEDKLFIDIIDSILDFFNVDIIKSMYPAYAQGAYFEKTKKKLISLLWNEYEGANHKWEIALENFEGIHSIPIMTIHKSKGLEYDTIYFIGLEDSAFWNFRNQPMEDRCAFFVALSRAKRNVNFTFSEDRKVGFNDVQTHIVINEFYELLEKSKIVDVIELQSM